MKIGAIVLILFSCVAFALSAYNLFNLYSHPLKFQDEITYYAKKHELSPALISSVINVESSFNENAKSHKNALGLMQIKLNTANYMQELNKKQYLTEQDLFNPKTNIDLGCTYLKYLLKKFNDINTSLAAYNAGETIVRSWLNSGIYSTDGIILNYIPFKETRNYVEKINKNIKFYAKIYK
ncbi:MAG: lytic transglycosylase domain-containing protein [Clostridia bacterium]|nr:lytic transglycosylase domain-containing protein [Clostridia bacterium]